MLNNYTVGTRSNDSIDIFIVEVENCVFNLLGVNFFDLRSIVSICFFWFFFLILFDTPPRINKLLEREFFCLPFLSWGSLSLQPWFFRLLRIPLIVFNNFFFGHYVKLYNLINFSRFKRFVLEEKIFCQNQWLASGLSIYFRRRYAIVSLRSIFQDQEIFEITFFLNLNNFDRLFELMNLAENSRIHRIR